MASKQRRGNSANNVQRRGREIMRPIISSDIMGNRNVEVVPVGAWVEPADDDDFHSDALMAARIEEEKIRQMQNEKENRLRKFQQQTRHRVNKTNLLKRQQQIQEAEQAFEMERKVVQQSCLTGDLPRKDTCMLRQDLDLAIRKRLLEKYGEDVSTWENETVPALHSHTEESHQVTDKARQQLVSKKITQNNSDINNCNSDWPVKTIKKDIQVPTVRSIVDVDLPASHNTRHRNKNEVGDRDNTDLGGNVDKGLPPTSKPLFGDKNNNCREEESTEVETKVHFTDQHSREQHRHRKKKRSPQRPTSAQMAAILLRDSESDVLARQRRHQTAIARKIFMDRERETVRENNRRQHHRKKIEILKKEKEMYRQELEEIAHKELTSTNSVTGESQEELKLREQMEALQVQEMVNERRNASRKMREMKRYLNALRHTLLEKVTRQGVQLPSLCACGDTVWDTHPDTCANNCFFYKNPRAYARALQSLLSSAEVM